MIIDDLEEVWRKTRVTDAVKPYLWSSDEFRGFLGEAQIEAVRRAHLLVDSTSPLTQPDVIAGDLLVALDPRVISVRRVRTASRGRALVRKSARDMDCEVPGWEDATPSCPIVFIPDYESNKLALWPPSKDDDTLRLTVIREPLSLISEDSDELEIPPRYHLSLLYWVSYRAYMKPDADTLNPGEAKAALEHFEAEFGKRSAAIDEHWNAEQNHDLGDY